MILFFLLNSSVSYSCCQCCTFLSYILCSCLAPFLQQSFPFLLTPIDSHAPKSHHHGLGITGEDLTPLLLLLKTNYHRLKKEGFVCTGWRGVVQMLWLFCCSAVVDLVSTEVMFT